ncbi:GAF and ANTAR domain-containing protein [Actinoplanes sp. NPDC051851]|uniref:GAF and ANTAR domain-containing protein n=1 Tax=Actinoplanes sp. NPDC051851 TaxID=3154753 RepID=UPI003415E66D
MSVPQRRVPAAPRATRSRRRAASATPLPGRPRRLVAGSRSRSVKPSVFPGSGPHPVELAGLLHEVSVRLLSADTLPQALDRLAAVTAGTLPGAIRCSVVLIGEGGPLTVTGVGAAGTSCDDFAYANSLGPGLEAARTRILVTSEDLRSDERWPELGEYASADGIRAVLAVPLDVRRTAVGAVTVCLDHSGEIAPDLMLTAMAIAGQAEVLLGELRRREALTEGSAVDRAVGVIIAQRGCGVQQAYGILQESAQRLGLDRRTVAERLVAAAARDRESST